MSDDPGTRETHMIEHPEQHTQRCLDYARKTGHPFCTVECGSVRRDPHLPPMRGRYARLLDAAKAIGDDYCDGFNITEYGCTCPVHELMAAVKDVVQHQRVPDTGGTK